MQRNLQRTAGMVRHEFRFIKVQLLACAPGHGRCLLPPVAFPCPFIRR
ncbi:hypothetical protein SEA_BEEM_105 [Mycobacterium phage Beem]|nr:hypothetical protein SEA_BEEM_105 [Mycobacterium phage Beem]